MVHFGEFSVRSKFQSIKSSSERLDSCVITDDDATIVGSVPGATFSLHRSTNDSLLPLNDHIIYRITFKTKCCAATVDWTRRMDGLGWDVFNDELTCPCGQFNPAVQAHFKRSSNEHLRETVVWPVAGVLAVLVAAKGKKPEGKKKPGSNKSKGKKPEGSTSKPPNPQPATTAYVKPTNRPKEVNHELSDKYFNKSQDHTVAIGKILVGRKLDQLTEGAYTGGIIANDLAHGHVADVLQTALEAQVDAAVADTSTVGHVLIESGKAVGHSNHGQKTWVAEQYAAAKGITVYAAFKELDDLGVFDDYDNFGA